MELGPCCILWHLHVFVSIWTQTLDADLIFSQYQSKILGLCVPRLGTVFYGFLLENRSQSVTVWWGCVRRCVQMKGHFCVWAVGTWHACQESFLALIRWASRDQLAHWLRFSSSKNGDQLPFPASLKSYNNYCHVISLNEKCHLTAVGTLRKLKIESGTFIPQGSAANVQNFCPSHLNTLHI